MTLACMWMLSFFIYRTDDDFAFEPGDITATSCAVAEQHMRAALRPNQMLYVISCECVGSADK